MRSATKHTLSDALRVIAMSLVALTAWSSAGVCDPGAVTVELDELDRGTYQVAGQFWVDGSVDAAWSVLTDYAQINQFASSVRKSRVTESNGIHHTVEQQAVVRFALLSWKLSVTLQVEEDPGRMIRFTDVSGKDFERYHGAWILDPHEGGVRVTYTLEAKPRRSAPHFIERMMVNRGAVGLLREVRDEIDRRAKG